MTFLRWTYRLFGVAATTILVLFLAVQVQQRSLRRRAERLSADMRQMVLYRSTWADAQRLMNRWGRSGFYEGSCTARSCRYTIEMTDPSFLTPHAPRHAWIDWLLQHDRFNLYHWLGGRSAGFQASFRVHDGIVFRKSSAVAVAVSSRRPRSADTFDRTLFLSAQSRQGLHRSLADPFDVGSDDQLAQHPYYKVGRPDGCKINCQMASVTYSTRMQPAEIDRLTAYDFSCFTRFTPCAELGDVLPAARGWHLYDEGPPEATAAAPGSLPLRSCDIPIWALARDARYVLTIEVLSAECGIEHETEVRGARVRVIESLKAVSPWPIGSLVEAYPFSGNRFVSPPQEAEVLVPGRRFLVFPAGDDRRDRSFSKDSPIRLDRCGVQDDTSAVRRELVTGFAQNDALADE